MGSAATLKTSGPLASPISIRLGFTASGGSSPPSVRTTCGRSVSHSVTVFPALADGHELPLAQEHGAARRVRRRGHGRDLARWR